MKKKFIWRHAGIASAHTLHFAAVSRWVSIARGQPLDGRLRKASSPTYSFRVSIRIYLFLLTKTLNSKAERTDVFVRNCKDKKFTQLTSSRAYQLTSIQSLSFRASCFSLISLSVRISLPLFILFVFDFTCSRLKAHGASSHGGVFAFNHQL